MKSCKHNWNIVETWNTGYLEKCTLCDQTRAHDVEAAERDTKKFIAITVGIGVIIGLIDGIFF